MARQEIQVGRKDRDVFLVLDGRRLLDMGWKMALDFARALRVQLRAARTWEKDGSLPTVPELAAGALAVRQEGARVLVLGNGALLVDLPWRVAASLWAAVTTKAREAEELDSADAIARDGAILFRSGAPFGLTSNPAIQDEIVKAAVHDRDLRRFMPDGVKSTVILGAPAVRQHQPDPGAEVRRLAEKMAPADRRALAAQLGGAEPTA